MSRAPALRALLALGLMLLMLLSIVSWLHDGHVTPEQGLWHALAVAQRGGHVHGDRAANHHHHGPAEHESGAPLPLGEVGELLLTAPAVTSFVGLWQALVAAGLALLALRYLGPAERPPGRALASHQPKLLVPPPR